MSRHSAFTGVAFEKYGNPAVPWPVEEVVVDMIACADAGLSRGDIHVRTEDVRDLAMSSGRAHETPVGLRERRRLGNTC